MYIFFLYQKNCSVKLSHCFLSKKKPHIINATCSTHKKVFLKKLDKNPVMETIYMLCVKHQHYYYLVVVPFWIMLHEIKNFHYPYYQHKSSR